MRMQHAALSLGMFVLALGIAPACSSSDAAAACTKGTDCASNTCGGDGKCTPAANGSTLAASPSDGAKNADETDVDCGGAKAPKCADGKKCAAGTDCTNAICDKGVCQSVACDDGAKDATETDVDCGGGACPKCADTKACKTADDCTSGVCTGGSCQVPSPTDKVKNGTETDVDCGGDPANPRCDTGQACLDHPDCTSNGCDYNHKCAAFPSCTAHNGGDTCGAGGDGGTGAAQWESCCAVAPTKAGGPQMNKYKVTSGRFRAFLERTKGNVRQAVKDARAANKLHGATMDPGWDLYLPTSMEGCDTLGNCGDDELADGTYDDATPHPGIYTSAYRQVGGTIFQGENQSQQGCSVQSPGTHTYWMPNDVQTNYFGDIPAEQPQAVYDTKALNCVNYLMAQSFCIWDGGRLLTMQEYADAGGVPDEGDGGGAVPWGTPVPWGPGTDSYYGNRFPTAADADVSGLPAGHSVEWANYNYSYEYPNLGPNNDFIVFISAPGRLKARGPNGHADLVGDLMEVTSTVSSVTANPKTSLALWTANGSWEGHGWGYWKWNFSLTNKYGKQGLRCTYPD